MVNATFDWIGKKIPIPRLSRVTKSGVKQIMGKRAEVGFRLEKFLEGSLRAMSVIMKYDCYGFGYKPKKDDETEKGEKDS